MTIWEKMTYNPNLQFRCTIIRGKSKKDLDNLLPSYANIIDEICPCEKPVFETEFNEKIAAILKKSDKKTLDNHRTEIAGKLFGMYYIDQAGFVFPSARTLKYLEDSDQPAFFKDICFKFQFPNGMDKITTTTQEKIENNISIRQFPYILKTMILAQEKKVCITKEEIYYYVLNSLQVLQNAVAPEIVLSVIMANRKNGITLKVRDVYPDKKPSYSMQHMREQLNLLELANLIYLSDECLKLNTREIDTILYFAEFWNTPPAFNVYKYSLETVEYRKKFQYDWDFYYGNINNDRPFVTDITSLEIDVENATDKRDNSIPTSVKIQTVLNKNELGDEGEKYVLELEKDRVRSFDPSLVRKVIHFGKTRGLGYDIQSVVAEEGKHAEFVKYIEVKSTKRITAPDLNNDNWIDTINLTRNEWVAAEQHGNSYVVYRVYFVQGEVIIYILENLIQKYNDKVIKVKPISYRLEFNRDAVDFKVEETWKKVKL